MDSYRQPESITSSVLILRLDGAGESDFTDKNASEIAHLESCGERFRMN